MPPAMHTDEEHRGYSRAGSADDDVTVWVAERGGEPLGFAMCTPTFLDGLYVRPDLKGQGIGSLLLDVVEATHPERLRAVGLREQHRRARLYERRGLVERRAHRRRRATRRRRPTSGWPGPARPVAFLRPDRLVDTPRELLPGGRPDRAVSRKATPPATADRCRASRVIRAGDPSARRVPALRDLIGARRALYTVPDEQVTDRLDVTPWLDAKVAAVLAHRTEVARGALPGLVAGLSPEERTRCCPPSGTYAGPRHGLAGHRPRCHRHAGERGHPRIPEPVRRACDRAQRTAFFTSATIFFSTAAVHGRERVRRRPQVAVVEVAASWKPRVA